MIATLDQDRCRSIAGQMDSEYTRGNVANPLYDAVVEGLEFGSRDLPRAEDREWIRSSIAIPVQEAPEAALQVLVWSIGQALERAPTGLAGHFERSHDLEYLGIE